MYQTGSRSNDVKCWFLHILAHHLQYVAQHEGSVKKNVGGMVVLGTDMSWLKKALCDYSNPNRRPDWIGSTEKTSSLYSSNSFCCGWHICPLCLQILLSATAFPFPICQYWPITHPCQLQQLKGGRVIVGEWCQAAPKCVQVEQNHWIGPVTQTQDVTTDGEAVSRAEKPVTLQLSEYCNSRSALHSGSRVKF